MAVFSGLGVGTQADPFQITTVAQFNEMNSADWAGYYFKLMNDLDFSTETIFQISNFYCHFDGDNKNLNNIPLNGSGLVIQSGCSIKNTKIKVKEAVWTSSFYFFGSSSRTLSNVTIDNIRFISQIFTLNANQSIAFSYPITFDNTCYLAHLHIEGSFFYLHGKIKCIMEHCSYNVSLPYELITLDTGSIFRYNYININKAKYLSSFSSLISGSSGTITNNIFNIPYAVGTGDISILTNGANTIRDNLILSSKLQSSGAIYTISSNTSYGAVSRNFYSGDILSVNGTKSIFTNSVSNINYCYYQKSKVISIVPTDTAYKSVGLTDAQCVTSSSFNTFDFTNVWQLGESHPTLRNVQVPVFELPIFDTTTIIERVTGSTIKITTTSIDATVNYGFDLFVEGVLITNYDNINEVLYSNLVTDCIINIKPYVYNGINKVYVDSISYTHYFEDGYVNLTTIQSDKLISLNNGTNAAKWIHGTCMYNGYIYGSSRNIYSSASVNSPNKGCIVKVDVNNIDNYTLIPIYLNEAETINAMQMDSLVRIGKYLYTVASSTGNTYDSFLIKYDTDNDSYQVYKLAVASTQIQNNMNFGAPSTSDEQFIYVYLNNRRLHKIDVSVFNSTVKYNVSSLWTTNSIILNCVSHNTQGKINHPHTMVVDNNYLYVGFGSAASYSPSVPYEVQKINKSTMEFVDYVFTPKMTDDMTQNQDHIFLGIELMGSTNDYYGYGVGTVSIRKDNLQLKDIQSLSQYTRSVASYASLIFGNYLIDLRSNGIIATIDISSPDTWEMTDLKGKYTLKNYKIFKPGTQNIIDRPVNEVFLTESGKFIGFCWGEISDIIQFDLTGLNYFAAPTVLTENSAIIYNTISLSGYIQDTGGKTVTSAGFQIGTLPDLSDAIEVTTEPNKNFSVVAELASGNTYYYRAFAVNSEGTGYGSVESVSLAKTMKIFIGDKVIVKIYKGTMQLSGGYFNN